MHHGTPERLGNWKDKVSLKAAENRVSFIQVLNLDNATEEGNKPRGRQKQKVSWASGSCLVAIIPALWMLKQEDCCELEASLCYRGRPLFQHPPSPCIKIINYKSMFWKMKSVPVLSQAAVRTILPKKQGNRVKSRKHP